MTIGLETEGAVRVRVTVDGQNLADLLDLTQVNGARLRDGWFSTWTSEPSSWVVTWPVGIELLGDRLDIEAESLGPGAVKVVVARVVSRGHR